MIWRRLLIQGLTGVLTLLLAVAAPAAGAPAIAAETEEREERPRAQPLARLVAPLDGAELGAGELVWLEWVPGPGLEELEEVEEWEAFWSLDGGRTFPVRLTPHLTVESRRVSVRLPGTPSDDARLLLRFGNEKREFDQPVAARFRVRELRGVAVRPLARRWSLRRGEPARVGDAGVTAWAEGRRDGSGWTEVESLGTDSALSPTAQPSAGLWWLAAGPLREMAPEAQAPAESWGGTLSALTTPSRTSPAQRSIPILSLIQRLNE